MLIKQIVKLLKCPDCDGPLMLSEKLFCKKCKRKFYFEGNFIDLLPKTSVKLKKVFSQKAFNYYQEQFLVDPKEKFRSLDVWGEYNTANKGYRAFLEAEKDLIQKHFPKKKDVFCDISAASGFYTLSFARNYKLILHCDLNIKYLRYSMNKAKKQNIRNVVFIRSDYFRPPFKKNSINMLLCTDSLEYYGPENDARVLAANYESLAKNGVMIFDIHSYKFYAPDKNIFEYTKADLKLLQKQFPRLELHSFGRLPTFLVRSPKAFKLSEFLKFMPPIRYLGVLSK